MLTNKHGDPALMSFMLNPHRKLQYFLRYYNGQVYKSMSEG